MVPWPGSFTLHHGQTLKLFAPRLACGRGKAGTVLEAGEGGLIIACGEDAIAFDELQAPGKKRMRIADYVRGKPLVPGTTFGS